MFAKITSWFGSHSTAILATVIAVVKAGALGKGALAIITALTAAVGA